MSNLIKHIEEGTALDRIRIAFYDKKLSVHLSEKDKEYAETLAEIRDWWQDYKTDIATERMIIDKLHVDRRRAWEMLQDAKTLWALQYGFDETVELLAQKQWINEAFRIGTQELDGKMMAAALKANADWIDAMRKNNERSRVVAFTINITFHMDWREFMSEEEYAAAKAEMAEIKTKAKKRFKNYEDTDFVEVV